MSISEEGRKRPAPLAMAQDGDGAPRARLTLETFVPPGGSPGPQYAYYSQQSPSGYSTPTSATFSNAPSSPRFTPSMQPPSPNLSRSSFYNGTRPPARRLSVPSASNPFQQGPHGTTYPPVYFSPIPSSGGSVHSNASSMMASPTNSVFSIGRRESEAELEWRRRTWHPGTYQNYVARPATSGLSYHQTPDDSKPTLASQPAASQITRLPGIESFDHAPPPPTAPTRQLSNPTHVDQFGRHAGYNAPAESSASGREHRRTTSGVEAALHHNLNTLAIGNATPSKPPQTYKEQHPVRHLSFAERSTASGHHGFSQPKPNTVMFTDPSLQGGHQDQSDDARKTRRQGWYGAPVASSSGSQPIMIAQRTSPEDSSSSEGVPTPSTSQGTELHPAIRHANGTIEMQPPGTVLTEGQQKVVRSQSHSKPEPTRADSGFQPYMQYPGSLPGAYVTQAGHETAVYPGYSQQLARPVHDMGRLEALVAVATSEKHAVTSQP